MWHLCFEVSQVLSPETYYLWSALPVQYCLYRVARNRPTLFISVNHIRLHRATCPCHLVLMVTGVVVRGEMREWWMVIVVLLLARNNITSSPLCPHGTFRASLEMSVYCHFQTCCNENKQPGLGFFCVLISRHFMLHFDLIRIEWLFFFWSTKTNGLERGLSQHIRLLQRGKVCVLERVH